MQQLSEERRLTLSRVHALSEKTARETPRKGLTWDELEDYQREERIGRVKIHAAVARLKGIAQLNCPEQRLIFAVIEKGIADAEIVSSGSLTPSAQSYFNRDRHATHCEVVDLDPEFVRSTLRTFFLWAE